MKSICKFGTIAAVAAATLGVGLQTAAASPPAVAPQAVSAVAAAPAHAPAEYKRYLLNNTHHGVWGDDGVKGQVKNLSDKRIVVRDSTLGKEVDIWPGQTVVFYADRDIRKIGDLAEGNGTWLEISAYGDQHSRSEFRLCDPWLGRPDTLFWGPSRQVKNTRTGWRVGDSHHEITATHKFWVKREADSWQDKYDTWNTGDWAAFTIHVDQI